MEELMRDEMTVDDDEGEEFGEKRPSRLIVLRA